MNLKEYVVWLAAESAKKAIQPQILKLTAQMQSQSGTAATVVGYTPQQDAEGNPLPPDPTKITVRQAGSSVTRDITYKGSNPPQDTIFLNGPYGIC